MFSYLIERTVAPVPAVSLAEARAAARVLHDDEDVLFDIWIDAATDMIDGPFGYLGQCIASQTWQISFPANAVSVRGSIELPFGPVTSIASIKTFDGTTLSADLKADFELVAGRFDAVVQPKTGAAWPVLADRHDALQIEFVAGDAVAKAATKQAILMIIAHWHANREHSPMGADFQALGVAGLLQNERRFL